MTARTVNRQAMPPKKAAGTGPMSLAASPDSKAPSSLEELMKIILMAEMRPRMSSCEQSWMAVDRMTALTPSKAPLRASAMNDRMTFLLTANTRMQMPNPVTADNSQEPARCFMLILVSHSVITVAPMAGAALNMPRPLGPICSISAA